VRGSVALTPDRGPRAALAARRGDHRRRGAPGAPAARAQCARGGARPRPAQLLRPGTPPRPRRERGARAHGNPGLSDPPLSRPPQPARPARLPA
jgi:hypothetical protein